MARDQRIGVWPQGGRPPGPRCSPWHGNPSPRPLLRWNGSPGRGHPPRWPVQPLRPRERARGAKGGERAHCACVRPRPRDQGVAITWGHASQSARPGGASWPRSRAGRGRLPAIKSRRASAVRWGSPGGPRSRWAGGPSARQVGTGNVSPRLAPPLGTGPSARQGVATRSPASAHSCEPPGPLPRPRFRPWPARARRGPRGVPSEVLALGRPGGSRFPSSSDLPLAVRSARASPPATPPGGACPAGPSSPCRRPGRVHVLLFRVPAPCPRRGRPLSFLSRLFFLQLKFLNFVPSSEP